MVQITRKFFLVIISFFLGFFTLTVTAADDPSTAAISNLVGGYGINQLAATTNGKPNPTALFFQSADAVYNQIIGDLITSIINPSLAAQIPNTPSTDGQNQDLTPSVLTSSAITASLTTVDISSAVSNAITQAPGPIPLSPAVAQIENLPFGQQTIPVSSSTSAFDLNSLLLPLQYTINKQNNTNQKNDALNFIRFASNLNQPIPVIDTSNFNQDKITQAFQNGDYLQYLIALRSLTSKQSVGMSNYYYLYAERLPQDISKLSLSQAETDALKNTPLYPKASPLQIEHYFATRRYTDPNWNNNIQQLATPAELQRQTIYLLRDLLYVEHQRQLVDERILATLSTMQLGTLGGDQLTINQLYTKVNGEAPFNGK